MGTTWDPGQYERFAAPRLRPGLELLSRIPVESPKRVVDLGCGTGNLTAALAARWPGAEVIGVDHSSEMLARAAEVAPAVRFEEGDAATYEPPAGTDILFSNACFHWVREHDQLLPRLAGSLAPGGVLAFQIPISHTEPSHVLMREVLGELGLGSPALVEDLERPWVLGAADYHRILAPLARSVDVWETRYLQVLTGEDAVYEWVKGTGLRPVLEALEGEDQARFISAYRSALRDAYPARPGGTTTYPFPRLFVVASL